MHVSLVVLSCLQVCVNIGRNIRFSLIVLNVWTIVTRGTKKRPQVVINVTFLAQQV